MVCLKQLTHKRMSRHKGHPSDYKKPIRGHAWKKEGTERSCEHCGITVNASPYTKEERRRAALPFDAPIPYTTEHPWNKPKEEAI